MNQSSSRCGYAAQRRVFLVTHGRTILDSAEYPVGGDEPLDDVGRVEALALAENLAYVGPSRVISSPLQRAKATAEVIATHAGIPLDLDDRLAEREHSRRPAPVFAAAGPAVNRDLEEQPALLEQTVEAMGQVVARARAVLDEQLPGTDSWDDCAPIVMVTHPEVATLLLDDIDAGRRRWHESARRSAAWAVLAADHGRWLIQDADEAPAESQPGE